MGLFVFMTWRILRSVHTAAQQHIHPLMHLSALLSITVRNFNFLKNVDC